MPGVAKLAPGAWSWDPDFSGPGIILCWGGGESGASGQAITRGGKGGQAGWLCVDLQEFVAGPTGRVTGYNGVGGAEVPWTGGSGHPANPGERSYFGGGTTCNAPGGGDTTTIPQGRAKIPGNMGYEPASADWNGGKGGDAVSQGQYAGGAGGQSGGQQEGDPGAVPGGGGAGGGQSSTGNGAAGANGGCIIFPAPDATLPGYKLFGVNETYDFDPVGSNIFYPLGDGLAYFEAVGPGGGGRGGSGLQGGHGGSGGGWAARLRQVFRGVGYKGTVTAGGAGGTYGDGVFAQPTSGSPGAGPATWTLEPLRIIKKQRNGTVGTLWTCAAGDGTPQKCGFLVGETAVITGVDSNFNGSRTVVAVSDDRLSFSVAISSGISGPDVVNPSGTLAELSGPFVSAPAGLGATQNYNTGTPPAGGQASAAIGDTDLKESGGRGCKVQAGGAVNTTNGGGSGGGGLPLGGDGAWGGGSPLAKNPASAVGDAGNIPGGGGGGGKGVNGGNAGAGARGAAVVRYILELHGIWAGQQRYSVTRVKKWNGGLATEAVTASVWNGGLKRSPHRVLLHPESLKRRYPAYLPANYKGFFDRSSGVFNWRVGSKDMLEKLKDGDYDIVIFGDSVSEGWTSFDGIATGTPDRRLAFPAFGRDYISAAITALGFPLPKGGTGLIRTNSNQGRDPQWTVAGWAAGEPHYITSKNVGHIATFTPGLDTAGVQITGNKGAVVYSGGGITVKDSGGTTLATGPATTGLGDLNRIEFTFASTAGHVLKINPTAAVDTNLFGADIYKPGVRIHNMSQGGARASGDAAQSIWGPPTGMVAPSNMTACYTQSVMADLSKGGVADCYMVFLGGNDSFAGIDALTIKAAIKRITDMIRAGAPNAAIIITPDVHTPPRVVALMDLAMEDGLGLHDFYYQSRGLTEIFGKDYNGDVFGHLNSTTGAPWAGQLMKKAFTHNPS